MASSCVMFTEIGIAVFLQKRGSGFYDPAAKVQAEAVQSLDKTPMF